VLEGQQSWSLPFHPYSRKQRLTTAGLLRRPHDVNHQSGSLASGSLAVDVGSSIRGFPCRLLRIWNTIAGQSGSTPLARAAGHACWDDPRRNGRSPATMLFGMFSGMIAGLLCSEAILGCLARW
jgi:hypothetical protein